jgi:hypothetical protein
MQPRGAEFHLVLKNAGQLAATYRMGSGRTEL